MVTTTTARVAAVNTLPLGSVLSESAALGATTLVVEDGADFDEAGGVVIIDGAEVVTFVSSDDEAGTLTLSVPTTVVWDEGTRVELWDPATGSRVVETVAQILVEGTSQVGDSLEAIVDHALIPFLPEGIRDVDLESGLVGEAVSVEWRGDELVVVNILGQAPIMDGSMIDPDTLPPSGGTPEVPEAPQAPVIVGGIGIMFAKWGAVEHPNPVVYAVHVSTAQGFTPDGGTLVGMVSGTQITIKDMGDGVPLEYGTVYYVRVVALDTVDESFASEPGPEGAGGTVKVTHEDIAANSIAAENIVSGAITADKLSADSVSAETIQGGAIDGQTITGGSFRTSDTVGQSDATTSWLGADNASASRVEGEGFSPRINRMRDPAGVNPSVWAETSGATAAPGADLFGRGGTVFSSGAALTVALSDGSFVDRIPDGNLVVSGQFDSTAGVEAYVHERGTSRDGTLFVKSTDRPSAAASGSEFHILSGGRFAWIDSNTSVTSGSTSAVSSDKAGGNVVSLTLPGATIPYANRLVAPDSNDIWTVDGLSGLTRAIFDSSTGYSFGQFSGEVTAYRGKLSSGGDVISRSIGASNAEYGYVAVAANGDLYAVWAVNQDLEPDGFTPRTRSWGYIRRITPSGSVTTASWFGAYIYTGYFGDLSIHGVRPLPSGGVRVAVGFPGSLVVDTYYRVADNGARTNSSESAYNTPNVAYPDDLNGSPVEFDYSTEGSQIPGTPVVRVDNQTLYLEHPTTRAVWTFNRTRSKHAVPLGTALPNDEGRYRWQNTYAWSGVPLPVITFKTSARGSSFIAESAASHSFWFSGDAADAGGGAGGILDSTSLRGYADNGGIATELDFSTGVLTAHGANIDGVLQSQNGPGTMTARMVGGALELATPSGVQAVLRGDGSGNLGPFSFDSGGAFSPSYDTGWITVPPASGSTGTLEGRRIGNVIYLRGSITPGSEWLNATTKTLVSDVPAILQPPSQFRFVGAPSAVSGDLYFNVAVGSSITARANRGAGPTAVFFPLTYLAD